jgi:hypothetical protein
MPVLAISAILGLATSGCAGFNRDEAAPQAAVPPPAPEGKRLAELATAAFATAKLTGTPEVSSVHATHDSQWGDWMFCIRGAGPAPSPKYAVLVGHDAVLEVRTSVLIDGCDRETYHPLPPAAKPAKAAAHKP